MSSILKIFRGGPDWIEKFVPSANTAIMSFGTFTQVAANKNIFFGFDQNAVDHRVHIICPIRGLIHDLYTHSNIAPGLGLTFTYELYKKGIGTGIAVQVSGAVDKEGSDLFNTATVEPGDDLSVNLITPIGGGVSVHSASIRIEVR